MLLAALSDFLQSSPIPFYNTSRASEGFPVK